jgi:hypothetical protein
MDQCTFKAESHPNACIWHLDFLVEINVDEFKFLELILSEVLLRPPLEVVPRGVEPFKLLG